MSPKVLIVEDEDDIRAVISYALGAAGLEVSQAASGPEALEKAREGPDLVVLDLMLPGLDGKEVCRRLKNDPVFGDPAVIMLTARAEEIDRVVGFELGADDYLTKPFSPRELVLRVQAILRRLKTEPARPSPNRCLCFGDDLVIDPEACSVTAGGRLLSLTATEFKLLLFLAGRPGRVLSREVLLSEVWDYPWEGYARTVDTHMRRLRAKLGPQAEYLETVRGLGYRWGSGARTQSSGASDDE